MKKYVLILLVFTFLSIQGFSQEKKYNFNFNELTDSFKDSIALIDNLPESKDKAYLYLKAASYYFFKNGDSAIYFCKKAEAYTKSNDFKLLQINTHIYLVISFIHTNGGLVMGQWFFTFHHCFQQIFYKFDVG